MEKGNQDKRNESSYNPGYDQYMSLHLNSEDTHTKFWNTEPPSFSNTTEYLEAEDWITTIEKKLDMAQCIDREKVLYASGLLVGAAAEWWNSCIDKHDQP
jgi:hypothetical protein